MDTERKIERRVFVQAILAIALIISRFGPDNLVRRLYTLVRRLPDFPPNAAVACQTYSASTRAECPFKSCPILSSTYFGGDYRRQFRVGPLSVSPDEARLEIRNMAIPLAFRLADARAQLMRSHAAR